LRIFNISDPLHPREVAYYVSPPKAADENGAMASDFAMSKPAFDPAQREVWYTDGTSGFYVLKLDDAVWPDPTTIPNTTGCVSPTGMLGGTHLGQLTLGETRRAARATFTQYDTTGHRHIDVYCLSGGGLRAAYASPALLRALSVRGPRRLAGRIVLALTSDPFYKLRGVAPGTSFTTARRTLHPGRGYAAGGNTWYIVRDGAANGVMRVHKGVVEEVGVVPRQLVSTASRARTFFRSFGRSKPV
jgi:hypothetical protein